MSLFGLSTPSTSQLTPCWNCNCKSHFNALSTCGWQLYPHGSLGATLIGPSTPNHFWFGKIGANQVWKVLRPAPYEIRRRTFLKSISQSVSQSITHKSFSQMVSPWTVELVTVVSQSFNHKSFTQLVSPQTIESAIQSINKLIKSFTHLVSPWTVESVSQSMNQP